MRSAERYDRLYDVVKNMEWHLEHTPEHPLSELVADGYRAIESNGFPIGQSGSVPGVVIVYRFDATTVYIWDIRITPPPTIRRA